VEAGNNVEMFINQFQTTPRASNSSCDGVSAARQYQPVTKSIHRKEVATIHESCKGLPLLLLLGILLGALLAKPSRESKSHTAEFCDD
jgi:hypothetical protein